MYKRSFGIALLLLLILTGKNIFSKNRIISISGLKVFTETDLLNELKPGEKIPSNLPPQTILKNISNFYKSRGYHLVKIYILKNTGDRLSIYIDEGRLGKIKFLNIDSLQILKLKVRYRFNKGIYNINTLKSIIKSLKETEGYDTVSYKLKKTANYDASMFQLDRELNLPVIGKRQLPFFEKFGAQYDLEFYISRSGKEERSGSVIDYKLKTDYTRGFIPQIRYFNYNLLQWDDRLEAGCSVGIMYGFNREFNRLPYITFHKIDLLYKTAPLFTRHFTPFVKSVLYRSRSSRKDLGLLKYNYLIIKSDFAPGITLLKKFEIYTGIGIENSMIFNSEVDPDKESIEDMGIGKNRYPYFEVSFRFSRLPFYIWNPIKQKIRITYDHYFRTQIFDKLTLKGESHFSHGDFSTHIINLNYSKIWHRPPFYHDIPVSSSSFKGFMGKSFHTRHIFAISNEIRTSIYRDFAFIGIFIDSVIFKGSGYDLTGIQCGIAAGPAIRFLILSQFTMYIYYGRDLLISTEESQNNVSFGLFKKW